MPVKILLTGANGFIGTAIGVTYIAKGGGVRAAIRRNKELPLALDEKFSVVGEIDGRTSWSGAFRDVSVVVHAAARVHVMNRKIRNSLVEYRKINVDGTLNLIRQAAASGVRRFIYISSVKVIGESTRLGKPYEVGDEVSPKDPYGVSKFEAELGLRRVASKLGIEIVIIRPPLVYGPGVKANFLSMMDWLSKGVPLPFGSLTNQRSLVALENLVDLVITCIDHPAAANQTFLVSDGQDLSTTELLRQMAKLLGKRVWLLPIPAQVLESLAPVFGKQDLIERLCGTFQIDISRTCELLDWSPPTSSVEAMNKTAEYYLENNC
jgi:UDP-N-acetyl-alpha-D-quinovosamine dehydrogenase